METRNDIEKLALTEIIAEYRRAAEKFNSFHSTHEGYAVLKEEVDELWDEIKANGSKENTREEAVQVAAMGLRFIIDCCS